MFCEQALALCHEIGERLCEGGTWDSLGYIHHNLGNHLHAFAYYQQAIDRWRELGNRYHQATTLVHLGETQYSAAGREAARVTWQQALAILDDLHHPDADKVRVKLLLAAT